ncbi:MAG TPA: DUF177 domain-containing protein [Cytophagaceae bacterium]|nr:DUF177 domain-containing protein [Cytophagaceae bacterium]
MKSLKEFDIEIFRLTDGKQSFDYDLDDKFFAAIEGSILEKGKLKATVVLDRSERLILADFKIKGIVELLCDRSVEPYDYEIDSDENLVFKFGDEFEELSEDVIMIPRDLQKLNLAQYLYEFIGLAIPMKRLHPKFQEEDTEEEDEQETRLIYRSDENEDNKSDDSETIDPRWNALKDLKNKLK